MEDNGVIQISDFFFNRFLSPEAFYAFLNDYEALIIIGLLTMCFSLLKRNKTAFVAQIGIFLALWLQHWVADTFEPLILISTWFKVLVASLFYALILLQTSSFLMILYELHREIQKK